ncbi:hypothetical protein AHMF7605_08015 [Adhaeribacter arboris]|uniref:Uncharacterized protein n=2 Tax=Adhaeribacter arboris TaxID=2072846 RepID=A0A2T2YD98_9BACT|nr:hypothetical protein AHMF7605_08015 [Adhaeribacter arboris]
MLIILIIHLFTFVLIGFGLNGWLVYVWKVETYLSGILLFFISIKKHKRIAFYTSFYILAPIGIFLARLADGILAGLIGSLLLAFLVPPTYVLADKNYQIRREFTGFLGGCCSYTIKENKLWLFEKTVAEFRSVHEPTEISKLEVVKNIYAVIHYKPEGKKDSTLVLLNQ